MRILIDGDAFPNILKQITFRAIVREKIETIIVANKKINIGNSSFIKYIVVEQGPDVADNYIADISQENDIVITDDIPLADRVIANKSLVLKHRGKILDEENIKNALAMRNLMYEIRDFGEQTKGPAPLTQKDSHNFANNLNKLLLSVKK